MHRLASQGAVERILPLLNHLAIDIAEKTAILLYLDALAGLAAGTLTLIRRKGANGSETIVVRAVDVGTEWSVVRPGSLPLAIEPLAVAEYRRLIAGEPLSAMDPRLFAHLFAASYCGNCRYRAEQQICFECRYAGEPVNFLPFEPEAAPPLASG